MTMVSWRIAGLLFAAGGVASATGAALFANRPAGIGSGLTIVGVILEGIGLILLGLGFRRSRLPSWAPWLFVSAGSVEIVFALLATTGIGIGLATIAIGLLILVLFAAAAVATAVTRATRRAVYVTLVVLAVCDLINDFSGAPATLELVGVVYVVLGILLLSGARPLPRT